MTAALLYVVISCAGVSGKAYINFPNERHCQAVAKDLKGKMCVKVAVCKRR